jgi:predicted nucleic acid-binding protein
VYQKQRDGSQKRLFSRVFSLTFFAECDARRLHSKAICDSSQVAFLLALAARRRAKKQPRLLEIGLFLLTLPPVSVDFQADRAASEARQRGICKSNSVIVPCRSE